MITKKYYINSFYKKCINWGRFRKNNHECYGNFERSLKAMGAFAFVQMHMRAYTDLNLWYGEVVSDDDSTVRSFLRHQFKNLIASGLMHEKDWPLTKMVIKKQIIEKFF